MALVSVVKVVTVVVDGIVEEEVEGIMGTSSGVEDTERLLFMLYYFIVWLHHKKFYMTWAGSKSLAQSV